MFTSKGGSYKFVRSAGAKRHHVTSVFDDSASKAFDALLAKGKLTSSLKPMKFKPTGLSVVNCLVEQSSTAKVHNPFDFVDDPLDDSPPLNFSNKPSSKRKIEQVSIDSNQSELSDTAPVVDCFVRSNDLEICNSSSKKSKIAEKETPKKSISTEFDLPDVDELFPSSQNSSVALSASQHSVDIDLVELEDNSQPDDASCRTRVGGDSQDDSARMETWSRSVWQRYDYNLDHLSRSFILPTDFSPLTSGSSPIIEPRLPNSEPPHKSRVDDFKLPAVPVRLPIRSRTDEDTPPSSRISTTNPSTSSAESLPENLPSSHRNVFLASSPGKKPLSYKRAGYNPRGWLSHNDPDEGEPPKNKLMVPKKDKNLYTVVKRTKDASSVRLNGDLQQFLDDVAYLAAGLTANNPSPARCASTLSLAENATDTTFRTQLRARKFVPKFINALSDAPRTSPSLSLATGCLCLVLATDQVGTELDRRALGLLSALLDLSDPLRQPATSSTAPDSAASTSAESAKEFRDTRERVRTILRPNGVRLSTEELTCDSLALETLVRLLARGVRADLRDDLMSSGAVGKLILMAERCYKEAAEGSQSSFTRVMKCFKVLQTLVDDEDVSRRVADFRDGLVIRTAVSALNLAHKRLSQAADGEAPCMSDAQSLSVFFSFLVNFTQFRGTVGSRFTTRNASDLLSLSLDVVFSLAPRLADQQFDLKLLAVSLLTNVADWSAVNRKLLLDSRVVLRDNGSDGSSTAVRRRTALEAFISLFRSSEERARTLTLDECLDQSRLVSSVHSASPTVSSAPAPSESLEEEETPSALETSGWWQEDANGLRWVDNPNVRSDGRSQATLASIRPQAPHAAGSAPAAAAPSSVDVDNVFAKMISKAGSHMEDSIMAAYLALLLGVLMESESSCRHELTRSLGGDLGRMSDVLNKFLQFSGMVGILSPTGQNRIERIIDIVDGTSVAAQSLGTTPTAAAAVAPSCDSLSAFDFDE